MDTTKNFELLKKPKNLTLAKSIKISYMDNNDKKKRALKKYGYRLDEDLSNHNQTIGYNPTQKKLLQSTAGSHNLKDWGLDGNASILFGRLGKGYKNTTRYKEAERTLYNAREKYKDRSSTVLTGHSQGGTVTSYLPMDNTTKGFALNAGFTIGQKVTNRNGKLKHYRLLGDPVSILSSGSKNQNTLYGDNITPLDFIRKPFQSALDIHKQNAKSAHILI